MTHSFCHSVPLVRGETINFSGAGKCIYCGKTGDHKGLSREHIIPNAIHGSLFIPAACCGACQKEINNFETEVLRMNFDLVRKALALRANSHRAKKKERPTTIHARAPRGDSRRLPVGADMPQLLPYADFGGRADALTGKYRTEILGNYSNAIRNFERAFDRPEDSLGLMVQVQATTMYNFTRFIAKVCHSYATACLGLGSFVSTLDKVILTADSKLCPHFVGVAKRSLTASADTLHQLRVGIFQSNAALLPGLPMTKQRLVIANLDMFLDYHLPTFEVVVGYLPD